ncbi:hypothetical protein E1218_25720 [Kribbella turkmenica]|uniref:Phosphodiesterase n=1 Tax=Kribbella turkmenica TaxID=2530375 RepID=A0A4R4WHS5_9ACTN|nr:hypothetical protein [Kribbella turkmenica]TDD18589.1 hypothetical protein E1218_25720 [Kribbella turkmenica]
MNPEAPGLVRRLTDAPSQGFSAFFRGLAQLRRAPAVHPRGITFTARLLVDQLNPLISEGDHVATVRLSKGAGTPGRWPDVLGVALRLDPSCDFLFSSAGEGVWTRWFPTPAADWATAHYGTLAPYEAAGRWWWLMLIPAGGPVGHASVRDPEHPSSFILHLGDEPANWRPVGRLTLHERIDGSGLVFDPILNHPPDALPAPRWLRELRERAYSSSRQGRNAPPPVP